MIARRADVDATAKAAGLGHRHDGGIDDLSAARNVALRAEMRVEAIEQLFNNASLGELLAE